MKIIAGVLAALSLLCILAIVGGIVVAIAGWWAFDSYEVYTSALKIAGYSFLLLILLAFVGSHFGVAPQPEEEYCSHCVFECTDKASCGQCGDPVCSACFEKDEGICTICKNENYQRSPQYAEAVALAQARERELRERERISRENEKAREAARIVKRVLEIIGVQK